MTNKTRGILFIVAPFIGLFLVLTTWAITSFIIARLIASQPITPKPYIPPGKTIISAPTNTEISDLMTATRMINVALGFFGILCVISIPVGVIVGVMTLRSTTQPRGVGAIPVPDKIRGWNWGAFGLTLIWGLYHRIWIALLVFVPFVGIAIPIYLGLRGNELAWKMNKWESIEVFLAAQKKWRIWGIIFFFLSLASAGLRVMGSI